ncbi:MAG TPA: hypothetical protein VK968_05385 [Roseimicrobium sp.]|nr:hypothetical protein [Roseimicrobium sp.]
MMGSPGLGAFGVALLGPMTRASMVPLLTGGSAEPHAGHRPNNKGEQNGVNLEDGFTSEHGVRGQIFHISMEFQIISALSFHRPWSGFREMHHHL